MLSALRAYPGLRHQTEPARLAASDRRAKGARRAPGGGPPAGPGRGGSRAAGAARRAPDPALWRAVRRLPGKQRAAVTLRFAADLDYAAIGDVIECSEDAARQNVRAGLASVRREWVR